MRKAGLTGVLNSQTTSRPPGRVTRAISRSAASVSATLRSANESSPRRTWHRRTAAPARPRPAAAPADGCAGRPGDPQREVGADRRTPRSRASSAVDTPVPAPRSSTCSSARDRARPGSRGANPGPARTTGRCRSGCTGPRRRRTSPPPRVVACPDQRAGPAGCDSHSDRPCQQPSPAATAPSGMAQRPQDAPDPARWRTTSAGSGTSFTTCYYLRTAPERACQAGRLLVVRSHQDQLATTRRHEHQPTGEEHQRTDSADHLGLGTGDRQETASPPPPPPPLPSRRAPPRRRRRCCRPRRSPAVRLRHSSTEPAA